MLQMIHVPITRFTFLQPYLRDCLGFIIDGDMAIKWKETCEPARHFSVGRSLSYTTLLSLTVLQGTLPFISYCILKYWVSNEHPLHTAIDDLESFVWVLVWAGLLQSTLRTPEEDAWLRCLASDDITTVCGGKAMIMLDLCPGYLHPEDVSEPLQTFLPLLIGWFTIAGEGRKAVQVFTEKWVGRNSVDDQASQISELEELCLNYYRQYLVQAVEFLASLYWPLGLVSAGWNYLI
jgi:hypothetical protein